jgi:hypothetical protein
MKKITCLIGLIFVSILIVSLRQTEADRGGGGSSWSGGHRGSVTQRGFHGGQGRHFGGHSGHRRFFPGLFIGGVLGWGFFSNYYYPPANYYPTPPDYYPPPAPPDYYYPPPEGSQTPPSGRQGSAGWMFIYPRQGQSEEQQSKDFDECHNLALGQTGFDPEKPPDGPPDAQTIQKSQDYLRAISTCLDDRGYTLK